MAEFVGKRTALPHGVPGTCDTDKYGSADRVPHGQAMLVRARVKHSHINPGRLLDDRHKITQRLHSEMVILAELRSGCAAFRLRGQRTLTCLDGCRDRLAGQVIVQLEEMQQRLAHAVHVRVVRGTCRALDPLSYRYRSQPVQRL